MSYVAIHNRIRRRTLRGDVSALSYPPSTTLCAARKEPRCDILWCFVALPQFAELLLTNRREEEGERRIRTRIFYGNHTPLKFYSVPGRSQSVSQQRCSRDGDELDWNARLRAIPGTDLQYQYLRRECVSDLT